MPDNCFCIAGNEDVFARILTMLRLYLGSVSCSLKIDLSYAVSAPSASCRVALVLPNAASLVSTSLRFKGHERAADLD